MKVIDLLNKIANGEEVPFEIKLFGVTFCFNNEKQCYFSKYDKCNILDMHSHLRNKGNLLNEEVEIIEEKKIPEKIKIDNEDRIQALSTGNFVYKVNQPTKNIIYKINEIIDYLKSKGDE